MTEIQLTFFQRRVTNSPRLARFLGCEGGTREILRRQLMGKIDDNSAKSITALGRLRDSSPAVHERLASIVEMARELKHRAGWESSQAIDAALIAMGRIGAKKFIPQLESVMKGKDGYEPVLLELSAAAARSLLAIEKPAKGAARREELEAFTLAEHFARILLKYVDNQPVNIERLAAKLQRLGKNAQAALVRAFHVYDEPNMRRNFLALILLCDWRAGEGVVKDLQLSGGEGHDLRRVSEMIDAAKRGALRLI